MNEYHFLDENTELTKSDLIKKYNRKMCLF